MHKQQIFNMHINSKFFSLFVSSSTKGRRQTNNKDVYVIYIHEEERHYGSSPCIYALHGEGKTGP